METKLEQQGVCLTMRGVYGSLGWTDEACDEQEGSWGCSAGGGPVTAGTKRSLSMHCFILLIHLWMMCSRPGKCCLLAADESLPTERNPVDVIYLTVLLS